MALSQSAQDAIAIRRYEIDDPVRQAKLDELLAEQAALDDKLKEVRIAQAAANITLAEARATSTAADARTKDLDKRADKIDALSTEINNEKVLWESIRQKVDKEQGEREATLKSGEARLLQEGAILGKREDDVMGREKAVAEREARADVMHQNFAAVLSAHGVIAPTPVPKKAAAKPPKK